MKNFIIIIVFIIGISVFPVYSNDLINSLSFNHISKKDGLSDDLVFSIFQDSYGYIWIGTSNGLNRYDGYNFKIFVTNPKDPESIAHNVVTWICEDNDKNIWLATYGGGVSKFDRRTNTFRNYMSFDKTKENNGLIVNHINLDSKNRLWISSKGGGLILFIPGTQKVKRFGNNPVNSDSLNEDNIMSTFEDSSGNIWIATWGSGLYKYCEVSKEFKQIISDPYTGNDVQYKYIHSILEDPEKNLWLGTGKTGLVKYIKKTGSFQSFGIEQDRVVHIRKKKISTIFHDPDNDNLIWIGTENGLYIYRIAEDKFIEYKKENSEAGLSNNYVWSILRDRSGLLWIGTIGGGLNLEKRGSEFFSLFDKVEQKGNIFNSPNISAVYTDKRDASILWVGTLGSGLQKVDLQSGKSEMVRISVHKNNLIAGKNITRINPDPDNPDILYIGTNSGLSKYNIRENLFVRLESPLDELSKFNSAFISTLKTSGPSPRLLWIGSLGRGLYKLDLDKYNLSNYLLQKDFRNNPERNRVYTISPSLTDKNTLWLGTNEGLTRFAIRSGIFKLIFPKTTTKPGITAPVLSIYESEHQPGIIWCGTRKNGLIRFDTSSNSFNRLSINNGLPDNSIVSIVEEPRGTLWLGTLKGLSRFIISTGKFRNFDKREGLNNSSYNLNTSHVSHDGIVFISGSNGIDCFSPERLNTNMHIPPIVITGLKIFGSSELPGMDQILKNDISLTDEITLPHYYNTLTLSFAALDYTSPKKNQFSCRLESLNSNWTFLGTKNSINYRDLKPGKYTFIVKGSNSDSIWNETGRKLTIIITGTLISSFWFWIIIAVIVFFMVFLLRYLVRKFKKNSIPPGTTIEQLIRDEIITEREKEIITLILQGKSNKDIEDELFISLGTVKNHLYNIYKKLNVKSRTQLVSIVRSEEKP